jgi:glycosyltransferase involved in cell wall biosynthesis
MSTQALPGISVVLPALDEEGNVARAVNAARDAARRCAADVEVIVVDDGSSDGTAAEAERAGAHVVRHDRNHGYGAALRSGFAVATQPWIFQMDCDNQFDPEELDKLVARSDTAQVVIGVRSPRADPWPRVAAGRAWNMLCRIAFGNLARDIDCGFKLIDRTVVSGGGLRSDGACISVELCLAARDAGCTIAEVDVGHRPRTAGSATGLNPRVAARGLLELARLRLTYRRRR